MQSGAASMGEDGNYFSDLPRKLAKITFNWRISEHKYKSNPQPGLTLVLVCQCYPPVLQAGPGPSISIPGILATAHIYSDRLKPNRLPNGLFCSRSHAISECIIWIMLPFLPPQASALILKISQLFPFMLSVADNKTFQEKYFPLWIRQ